MNESQVWREYFADEITTSRAAELLGISVMELRRRAAPPAAKNSGTIRVTLRDRGRGKPTVVEDPYA